MNLPTYPNNPLPTREDLQLSRTLRTWLLLAATAFICYVVYATLANRAFFADGSFFYLDIITKPGTLNYYDDSKHIRLLVNIVNQWPVMLLSKVDGPPPWLLRLAFNAPLFAGNAILLGLLWLSARRHGTFLLWTYAAISYITTVIPSDIFPVNQARLAQTIYWCILFFATAPKPLNLLEKAFLCLLVAVSFRSHEAIIIFGPIITVAAFMGLRRHAHDKSWRKALMAAGITLCAFGIFWQLSHPVGKETSGFLENFKYWGRKEWWRSNFFLSWSGLVMLGAAVLTSRLGGRKGQRIPVLLGAAYAVICVLNGLMPFITKSALMPGSEFSFRIIIPFFGAALACAALLDFQTGLSRHLDRRVILGMAASALIGQCLWQLADTYRWSQFYAATKSVVTASPRTLIGSEDIKQSMPPRLSRYLMNYQWGWTWPAFSMAMLDAPEVRTLIKPDDHLHLFYISSRQPEALNIPFAALQSGRFDLSQVLALCTQASTRASSAGLCRD